MTHSIVSLTPLFLLISSAAVLSMMAFGIISTQRSNGYSLSSTSSNGVHTFSSSSSTANRSSSPLLPQTQPELLPRLEDKTEMLATLEKGLGQVFKPTQSTTKKNVSKLERLEADLARARASIKEAASQRRRKNTTGYPDSDYIPQGPIYRNPHAFHRSYLEMEKMFKIFVYEEGDPPMFHDGPCKSIYSTEGLFINEMEKKRNDHSNYLTSDPNEAHVYFLPYSVVNMVEFLYKRDPGAHTMDPMGHTIMDYVSVIASKYPYWNRSLGADHFMLSCHDWAPATSKYVHQLFHNSIRVLCNANTSEGFKPSKDATLPEIILKTGEITPGMIGGLSPSSRSILAFFAGQQHGDIRVLLMKQWKGKDKDVQVYSVLPDDLSYSDMMKKSKFCLCPSGFEVASPRIVEAIYAECVPVLISDHYIPPFSDVLDWRYFSVQIPVRDIPNIKNLLTNISASQYIRMQRRVKQVQRHFLVNVPPKRFDVFHMTTHSIWLRRLNIRIHKS